MKLSTPYIRLVLEVTLAAALIELLIMRLVPLSLPGISGWREAVADAVLLVLALSPPSCGGAACEHSSVMPAEAAAPPWNSTRPAAWA